MQRQNKQLASYTECLQTFWEKIERGKAWALERDVVGGWCEGALEFEQKIEVLVKGVCLCFALETELGTAFRVGKRV